MSRSQRSRRWIQGTFALSLLASAALLSGCFYPYPYRGHHGGGSYHYDDGHHGGGDRDRDHRDRDHDWDWRGDRDGRHR